MDHHEEGRLTDNGETAAPLFDCCKKNGGVNWVLFFPGPYDPSKVWTPWSNDCFSLLERCLRKQNIAWPPQAPTRFGCVGRCPTTPSPEPAPPPGPAPSSR